MNCVDVCPKNLNPTKAIGKIKELMVKRVGVMERRADMNRLQWKCRRGLLELDLVLAAISCSEASRGRATLSELLDLPDNDLWDIVSGRSDQYDDRVSAKSWRAFAPPRRNTMATRKPLCKLPDGKTLEFPVLPGRIGPDVDRHPHALRQDRDVHLRPGLPVDRELQLDDHLYRRRRRACCSIAATRSSSSRQHCDFLEVCYLLLNGELPNQQAEGRVRRHRHAPHHGARAARARSTSGFRRDSHPMAVMVGRGGRALGLLSRRARHQQSGSTARSRRSAWSRSCRPSSPWPTSTRSASRSCIRRTTSPTPRTSCA